MKRQKIYIIILSLVLIFLLIKDDFIQKVYNRINYKQLDRTEVLTNLHNIYGTNQHFHDIIFMGDSITELVNWNELLGLNIANRGIGSNTTNQMLKRINSIINEKPKYVFLMGGINDIKNKHTHNTYHNIVNIIGTLLENDIEPIIQSTLYVSNTVIGSNDINQKVFLLNEQIKNYCSLNNIKFIDLNQNISADGNLKQEFSLDGIHLNAKGYKVLSKVLSNFILNKLNYAI